MEEGAWGGYTQGLTTLGADLPLAPSIPVCNPIGSAPSAVNPPCALFHASALNNPGHAHPARGCVLEGVVLCSDRSVLNIPCRADTMAGRLSFALASLTRVATRRSLAPRAAVAFPGQAAPAALMSVGRGFHSSPPSLAKGEPKVKALSPTGETRGLTGERILY